MAGRYFAGVELFCDNLLSTRRANRGTTLTKYNDYATYCINLVQERIGGIELDFLTKEILVD